ncbi:MAG: class I SAM-dependent methyltransferase, partial [Planctomycetota bacterium]
MGAIGCHSCGAGGLRSFFDCPDIPTHNCLLLPDRESARAFPRGDLHLEMCTRCGFVQNRSFDPSTQAFSAAYEETQGFSPTFQRFLGNLAEGVVRRHGLQGARAFEIGCGKGEFLAALCAAGMARGTGYDPAFHPKRLEGPGADRVDVARELWRPEHGVDAADLIACRHTLEHIADVGAFVEGVRHAMGASSRGLVLFEVPCTERVFAETAFWDIYYEHCSYFTLGSLRRLFRRSGFEVLDVRRAYADQYLLLEARPGSVAAGA